MPRLDGIDLAKLTPTTVKCIKVVDTNVQYRFNDADGTVKEGTSLMKVHHYLLVEDKTTGAVIPLEIQFKNDRYMLSKDFVAVNVLNGQIKK